MRTSNTNMPRKFLSDQKDLTHISAMAPPVAAVASRAI
jgi:hypothetical protein